MNAPLVSKINWTAAVILCVGIVNTLGIIPPEWQKHALSATTIFAPALIIVFRNWFTGTKG